MFAIERVILFVKLGKRRCIVEKEASPLRGTSKFSLVG